MNQRRDDLRGLLIQLTHRYPRLNWGAHVSRLQAPGPGSNWREYEQGEDARYIDHIATARQTDGSILVRTSKASHHIPAMLVVDQTDLSNWGGHEANDTKANIVKSLSELTGMVLARQGDSFGWLICGKRTSYVRPRRDRQAIPQLQVDLDAAEPAATSSLASQLQHDSLLQASTKLVVVQADVHSLDDSTVQSRLKAIGLRCELIVIGVADTWDREMPDVGVRTLRFGDLQVPNLDTSNPRVQRYWAEEVVGPQVSQITSFLDGRPGVHYHEVRTDRPLMEQFTSIFAPPVRRRAS